MSEQRELNPSEYFEIVKARKQTVTDEDLSRIYDNCLELLNKYKITGQTAGMRKLLFHLESIEAEREIGKMGITTFIYRDDIEEYIDSKVLKNEIDAAYDSLKVELSELDANYRIDVENTNNKIIVVANSALKYLEKFGLEVYCIDGDATDKTISDVQNLINDKKVSYIYSFVEEELNDNVKQLVDNNADVSVLEVHRLDNITDAERKEKEDYVSIMKDNLDLIKKEIY